MDKNQIVSLAFEMLSSQLKSLKKIADEAHKEAINTELKQEGKYDTRAIEAGYLAGAQKQRITELEQEVTSLANFKFNSSSLKITQGDLLLLKKDKIQSYYFLTNISGGYKVNYDSKTIQFISALSPLGAALVLHNKDDEWIEYEFSHKIVEYQVLQVF